MDCTAAKRLIPTFVDGELSGEKAQHLDEHLADCTACRKELSDLRATMSALDAWTEIEPRLGYADLRARIEGRQAGWRFLLLRPAPRWAVAAALFFGLLVGSLSGVHHVALDMSHSHELTDGMQVASESLNLDAFGGGLNDALYEPVRDSGVTQ
jgi:predicted anti-sigma-YlaC factor YlaD